MIGLDFPLKPAWIHDVHALWEPQQNISVLKQLALNQTMQELGGAKTRANSLTIILRYFVGSTGRGSNRSTLSQDLWVAFSQTYSAQTMAPAYLAQVIAQNDIAKSIANIINRRYVLGEVIQSGDIRRYVVAQYGERKVVTNAVSAFLRTLSNFGILDALTRPGYYHYVGPAQISSSIFPLLVRLWWQVQAYVPYIDVDAFVEDTAFTFLEKDEFDRYWQYHKSNLWSLEDRLGVRRATLKYPAEDSFDQAIVSLLPHNFTDHKESV